MKKRYYTFFALLSLIVIGAIVYFYKTNNSFYSGKSKNKGNSIVEKDTSQQWAIEENTQQKTLQAVVPSPDGKYTLLKIKSPQRSQRDALEVLLIDNEKKSVLWKTPKTLYSFLPQWSPDGKYISVISFDPKSNNYGLWLVSPGTYNAVLSFSGNQQFLGYKWAPNSQALALLYGVNEGIETSASYEPGTIKMKVYLSIVPVNVPFKGWTRTGMLSLPNYLIPLYNEEPQKVIDWSPDSEEIAFVSQSPEPSLSGLFKINLTNKSISLVQEGGSPLFPAFSPDGKTIAFVADSDPSQDFAVKSRQVFLRNVEGTEKRSLSKTFSEDPHIIGWGEDDKYLLIQEGYKTLNRLYKLPLNGAKPEAVNLRDEYLISAVTLNQSRTRLGFVLESLSLSPQAFTSPLNHFNPQAIFDDFSEEASFKSEVIQWKSFDDRNIEGILIYPADYKESQQYPLVVAAHDGPYEAWQQKFIGGYYNDLPFSSGVLASQGYAVLLPNIRGSSNYGIEFAQANQKDLGGGDFKDLMTGIDFMIAKGVADPQKLAIWGWGYGGYIAAWATTQTNRFKAAIVGQGTTDLITSSGMTTKQGFLESYLGGYFWDNKELWLSRSPIMHVEKAQTPTLLQYDASFLVYQGKELGYALRSKNIPVELMIFQLENHLFELYSASRQLGMESTLNWLETYIKCEGKQPQNSEIKEN